MAIEECRNKIKSVLQGITVNILDKNDISESGVFLLYTGFEIDGGNMFRRFYLFVAGNSFDETLGDAELLENIEKKLAKKSLPPKSELKVLNGELIRFDDNGFYIFLIKLKARDDIWV